MLIIYLIFRTQFNTFFFTEKLLISENQNKAKSFNNFIGHFILVLIFAIGCLVTALLIKKEYSDVKDDVFVVWACKFLDFSILYNCNLRIDIEILTHKVNLLNCQTIFIRVFPLTGNIDKCAGNVHWIEQKENTCLKFKHLTKKCY